MINYLLKAMGIETDLVGELHVKNMNTIKIISKRISQLPKGVILYRGADASLVGSVCTALATYGKTLVAKVGQPLEVKYILENTDAEAIVLTVNKHTLDSDNDLEMYFEAVSEYAELSNKLVFVAVESMDTLKLEFEVSQGETILTEEFLLAKTPECVESLTTMFGLTDFSSPTVETSNADAEKIASLEETVKQLQAQLEQAQASQDEAVKTATDQLREKYEAKLASLSQPQPEPIQEPQPQPEPVQEPQPQPQLAPVTEEEVKVPDLTVEETEFDEERTNIQETPVQEAQPVQEPTPVQEAQPVQEPTSAQEAQPAQEQAPTMAQPEPEPVANERLEDVKVICPEDGISLAYIREYPQKYALATSAEYPDYEFYWIVGDVAKRVYQYQISTQELRLVTQ